MHSMIHVHDAGCYHRFSARGDACWLSQESECHRTCGSNTSFLFGFKCFSTVCFTELDWCIWTYEMLSKSANPAFWSSWLDQLPQAREIEHRKVFESKIITYMTHFRCHNYRLPCFTVPFVIGFYITLLIRLTQAHTHQRFLPCFRI